jgi:hypothetical protein
MNPKDKRELTEDKDFNGISEEERRDMERRQREESDRILGEKLNDSGFNNNDVESFLNDFFV